MTARHTQEGWAVTAQVPDPLPDDTMEDWIRRCYVTDELGNVLCLHCGAIIGSGWQVRHYNSAHNRPLSL